MHQRGHVGKRVVHLAAFAVTGTLLLGACGDGSDETIDDGDTPTVAVGNAEVTNEGVPVDGGKVTMGVTAETDGWNPAGNQWADAGNFVGSSFLEPLFVFDGEGSVVPWLAESAEPNEDASEWTIKVRPGILFQDGSPVDAAAVAASLNYSFEQGLASVAVGGSFESITATGDLTVSIELTHPWSAMLSNLAGPSGLMMAPSMIADPNSSSNPVGTGAFTFTKWEKDRYLRVNRFEDYWGGPCAVENPAEDIVALCEEAAIPLGQANGPFLDSMEFRPIPDALQRSQALEAGDVDLILTTRATDVAKLRADYQVVTDYDSEQSFVMTQTRKAPFDNVHARRALAFATDRITIAELAGGGEELHVDTSAFEETSVWGGLAPDQTGYPLYDPAKAQEEIARYKADMDAAGTPVESIAFTLTGLANTEDLLIMQALAEQWAAVGIKADIDTIKQEQLIGLLIGTDFQAAYYRNYAYPDPDSNYVFWSAENADGDIVINFSQYFDDITEAALDQGRTSQDFEVRKRAYTSLIEQRNKQAIDIWLFNTPYALIGNDNIRGLNWFRAIGFGNFLPKPYITGLWIAPKE